MAHIDTTNKLKDLSLIEQRAYRMNDLYNFNLEYLFECLFNFPENEWFKTDNKAFTSNYDACMELYRMNLICKKEEPIYRNGSFCGNNVYFKYNKNLTY